MKPYVKERPDSEQIIDRCLAYYVSSPAKIILSTMKKDKIRNIEGMIDQPSHAPAIMPKISPKTYRQSKKYSFSTLIAPHKLWSDVFVEKGLTFFG